MLKGLVRSNESIRNSPKLLIEFNTLYDMDKGVGVACIAYRTSRLRDLVFHTNSSYFEYQDINTKYYYNLSMLEEVYEV